MSKSTNSNTTATVNKSIEELMIELTNSTDMALFATACSAKNRVKDFLQGFKGGKVAEQFFNDGKFIDELLGYGSILDNFYLIFSDVFKTYQTEIKSLINAQKVPQIGGRTKMFRDMVFDRLKVSPGDSICEQLGEFAKTPAGKNFVDTMSTVDGANEEYLLDIAIILCTRSIMQRISEIASDINSRTTFVPRLERVEGEIVTEDAPVATGAAHTSNTVDNKEDIVDVTDLTVTVNPSKSEPTFMDKLNELFGQLTHNSSDVEIRRTIQIAVTACVKSGVNPLNNQTHQLTDGQKLVADILIGCLPEKYSTEISGFNIEDLASLIAAYHNGSVEDIKELHTSTTVYVCIYYSLIQSLMGDAELLTSLFTPLVRILIKHDFKFKEFTEKDFLELGMCLVTVCNTIDIVAYVDRVNKQIEIPVEHKSPLGYFSKAGDRALLKTMVRNFKKSCA